MHEARTVPRFPVQFRSSFTSTNVTGGEGSVVDLSVRGCRIESSTHILTGTVLELRIFASDEEAPLGIDQVIVRWTRGRVFGVEFVSIQPEEWVRLQQAVKRLDQGASARSIAPADDSRSTFKREVR
ncbi:MAG: PilZ domain-containing protein [Nitrospiraceae bacterium]